MCGEKCFFSFHFVNHRGSPPHVRGKARADVLSFGVAGITPACAGKSEFRSCRSGQTWDHPRMCGEKPALILRITWLRGSPPHVRGKAMAWTRTGWGRRITPACAGKRHITTK